MTDKDLEINRLCGEVALLKEEVALLKAAEELRFRDDVAPHWFAEELFFWRTKYLKDHPEHNTTDYVRHARENERIDVILFMESE